MPTYVALLRGINVGGFAVRMEDLRALFAGLGHAAVRTYIQSGNVLFQSGEADAARVRDEIEAHLQRELPRHVAVVVRSREEMAATAAGNPFLARGGDPRRLHVTMLAALPDAGRLRAIDADAYAPDAFEARGRDIYLYCPGGYGNTKLHNGFFESKLRTPATTRNWNTVLKLLDLCGA